MKNRIIEDMPSNIPLRWSVSGKRTSPHPMLENVPAVSITRRITAIIARISEVIKFLSIELPKLIRRYHIKSVGMDRVGFEPTTSAMPMPYPTGLDDRPCSNSGCRTILKGYV
jgi:hypothetical protein